jgi:hypothetical protein
MAASSFFLFRLSCYMTFASQVGLIVNDHVNQLVMDFERAHVLITSHESLHKREVDQLKLH